MKRLSDVFNVRSCTWVFGGCGGTFYCSVPYMQVLLEQYQPSGHRNFAVDPDEIEESNYGRQWPHREAGTRKAELAQEQFLHWLPIAPVNGKITTEGIVPSDKRQWPYTVTPRTDYYDVEGPMLLVLNVDNNRARLEAREWCIRRAAQWPTAMVVSGCDGEKGQVYWGLWLPESPVVPVGFTCGVGKEVHDWLRRHPDVEEDTAEDTRRGGCGGQTLYANALTGQLVGMAIENLDHYCYDSAPILEFGWNYDAKKGWRLWSTEVTPTSVALAKAQERLGGEGVSQ